MCDHEHLCVARAMGLAPADVERVNLSERMPTAGELVEASAVMMGGSGAFHIYDPEPWIERSLDFLGDWLPRGERPFLGMCFGHQAMVLACGGEVINDGDNEELGTFEIRLTEEGRRDPVFAGLPDAFDVQLGHVDRAVSLPAGWHNLANSASQPNQAVRMGEAPVYGFQFHAELRMEDNLYRVRHYAEHYGAECEQVFAELMGRHRPTPFGSAVMQGFVAEIKAFWEKQRCA